MDNHRIDPKIIYKFGMFDKLSFTQVVKTTEETIPLHSDNMTLQLLNTHDLAKYRSTHKFIHIGLVQVALKPLTLEGLPESFLLTLRDGRNLNWKQSLIGIMQSSLAHGAVYFNVYPNLSLSLTNINILDALTLNIQAYGYNYIPGSEIIAICYRVYYKPLYTLNPQCRMVDKPKNETILIESNFNRSNITTRRTIKWEEIEFPESWTIEHALPAQFIDNRVPTNISQTHDGRVQIQFENNRNLLTSRSHRSYSSHSHISPLDYQVRSPSRRSTSSIRPSNPESSSRVEELHISSDNVVRGLYSTPLDPDITVSEINFSV